MLDGQVHTVSSPRDIQPVPVDHRAAYDDFDDDDDVEYDDLEEDEEPHHSSLGGSMAVKFLLAGGVAGAGMRPLPLLHQMLIIS